MPILTLLCECCAFDLRCVCRTDRRKLCSWNFPRHCPGRHGGLCGEAVCCTGRKPTWRRCCEVYLRAPMSRGVAPFASAPTAAAWHERAASGAGIRNRAGGDSKSKGTSQRPDKSATRSGTSMGPGEHFVCGTFRKFPRGHARGMAAAVRDSTGASAKKSSGNFRTSQVPTQMWPWGPDPSPANSPPAQPLWAGRGLAHLRRDLAHLLRSDRLREAERAGRAAASMIDRRESSAHKRPRQRARHPLRSFASGTHPRQAPSKRERAARETFGSGRTARLAENQHVSVSR